VRHADEFGVGLEYDFIDSLGTRAETEGSFLVPLAATLKAGGLKLDVQTANREVLRWLPEVANVRIHATTGERPSVRLPADQAHLLRCR
jgi:transposase